MEIWTGAAFMKPTESVAVSQTDSRRDPLRRQRDLRQKGYRRAVGLPITVRGIGHAVVQERPRRVSTRDSIDERYHFLLELVGCLKLRHGVMAC